MSIFYFIDGRTIVQLYFFVRFITVQDVRHNRSNCLIILLTVTDFSKTFIIEVNLGIVAEDGRGFKGYIDGAVFMPYDGCSSAPCTGSLLFFKVCAPEIL